MQARRREKKNAKKKGKKEKQREKKKEKKKAQAGGAAGGVDDDDDDDDDDKDVHDKDREEEAAAETVLAPGGQARTASELGAGGGLSRMAAAAGGAVGGGASGDRMCSACTALGDSCALGKSSHRESSGGTSKAVGGEVRLAEDAENEKLNGRTRSAPLVDETAAGGGGEPDGRLGVGARKVGGDEGGGKEGGGVKEKGKARQEPPSSVATLEALVAAGLAASNDEKPLEDVWPDLPEAAALHLNALQLQVSGVDT